MSLLDYEVGLCDQVEPIKWEAKEANKNNNESISAY